jgi:hypothetical protein
MSRVTKVSTVTFVCPCNSSSEAFRSLKNSSTSGVGGSLVSRSNSSRIASSISSILSAPTRSFVDSSTTTAVYFSLWNAHLSKFVAKPFLNRCFVNMTLLVTFHAWTPDLWSSRQRECTLDEIIGLFPPLICVCPIFFQPSYIQRRSSPIFATLIR